LAPTGAIGQAVLDATVPVTPGDGRAVMIRDLEPNVAVFRDRPWARLAVMLQLRGQVMGVWLLGARHTGEHFDSRDLSFLRRLATWAGVAIENVRLFEALQTMAADRLRVRAAERTELANRLHDEPLQRAYAIARDLERLQSAQPADSPLAGELDRQRKAVRDLSRELRGITSGLRPPILSQGLIFALDDVMRRFGERFPGVHIERHIESEEPPALSDAALDAAYFVVTEALSNVGKHSHADQVTLQVESSPDQVNITVADNGNSVFLAGLSMVELLRGQHHGIVGMHQWAKAAQGSLRLLSAEPRGTRVELILPIAGAADNA
jgi:signal transduction histidine kinase